MTLRDELTAQATANDVTLRGKTNLASGSGGDLAKSTELLRQAAAALPGAVGNASLAAPVTMYRATDEHAEPTRHPEAATRARAAQAVEPVKTHVKTPAKKHVTAKK